MKKRYIPLVAMCAILSLLSSCDGTVNEKLFSDGGTQESQTGITIDGAVFAIVDENWENVISQTALTSAFAKNSDGLSFDGMVVRYEGGTEEKNIYLSTTDGQYVIINAPNATIEHHGKAAYTEIQDAKSYTLEGETGDLAVSKGVITLATPAKVDDFSVANGATDADLTITIKNIGNVGVFAYYTANVVKVNGEAPTADKVFGPDSAQICGIGANDKARIKNESYPQLDATLISSDGDVVRLVDDFEVDDSFGDRLTTGKILRIGAGVSLTVESENLSVGGTLENFGTIGIASGLKLLTSTTDSGERLIRNVGTINNPGGYVTVNASGTLENHGTITNSSSGKVTVTSGGKMENRGTLTNSAYVTVQGGGNLNNYGDIGNSGTVTVQTNESKENGSLMNYGTITNSSSLKTEYHYSSGYYYGPNFYNFGTITNSTASSKIDIVQGSTFLNGPKGTITNEGEFYNNGSTTNNGVITNTGSGKISGSGKFSMKAEKAASLGFEAMVGDNSYYCTLNNAIGSASSGNTITLLKDANMGSSSSGITNLTKSITLDLNGNTLTGSEANKITVNAEGATLTIKDSVGDGSIITTGTSSEDNLSYNAGIYVVKGKLIFESGTLSHTSKYYGTTAIYGASGTSIQITGGTISNTVDPDYSSVTDICSIKVYNSTVEIKGGRFKPTISDSSWIPSGYAISSEADAEGYYVVSST